VYGSSINENMIFFYQQKAMIFFLIWLLSVMLFFGLLRF